jgi:hypothetical protein
VWTISIWMSLVNTVMNLRVHKLSGNISSERLVTYQELRSVELVNSSLFYTIIFLVLKLCLEVSLDIKSGRRTRI